VAAGSVGVLAVEPAGFFDAGAALLRTPSRCSVDAGFAAGAGGASATFTGFASVALAHEALCESSQPAHAAALRDSAATAVYAIRDVVFIRHLPRAVMRRVNLRLALPHVNRCTAGS
jgi:hypothetical protein